jgi:hypothetical protein
MRAIKNTRIEIVEVEKVVPHSVTVTMTVEEATALRLLTYTLGGQGKIRRAVNSLGDALSLAGIAVPEGWKDDPKPWWEAAYIEPLFRVRAYKSKLSAWND